MARILVIDDEKNIRKMLRLTLERAGHHVDVADDGTTGLQLFGDGTAYDLVLTDQRMPGVQGREVTVEIRRRDPLARLVMMTSFATVDLASDVLRAGACDFLRKPFSAETLRRTVEIALARPRQAGQPVYPALPSPHKVGDVAPAITPAISNYFNGFAFWPVAPLHSERHDVQNKEIYRIFQLRGPSDESSRCTVAVTPHVEQQVRSEAGHNTSDFLWELVCRDAVVNYLGEKAEMPPALLPVYELTIDQLDDVKRLAQSQQEY